MLGWVSYPVSPLKDRLYVYDIHVETPYRRRGYGLAVLTELAARHAVPITPVTEVGSASRFWEAMRLARALRVTAALTFEGFLIECGRWQHLAQEAESISRAIRERLVAGEPYAQVVSRPIE